jgi:hypothetical protein
MSALRIPVIDTFAGEYLFLSNFAAAPTPHRGWLYPASEHAFAAAKTRDAAAIAAIRGTDDPAQAKRIGRAAPLVKGWEAGGKFAAMEEVVRAKFDQNADLARRLLATEGSLLVEGKHLAGPELGVMPLRRALRHSRDERARRHPDGCPVAAGSARWVTPEVDDSRGRSSSSRESRHAPRRAHARCWYPRRVRCIRRRGVVLDPGVPVSGFRRHAPPHPCARPVNFVVRVSAHSVIARHRRRVA